ncbi:hypothetical protein JL721_3470 [Aureococcus anophagefferens]|nr:hypothetical protein JL721_3470 [Aureococcus anophagefferens]
MRSSPLLRSMLVLNARAFGFLNAPLVGAARRGFRGGAAAPTLGLSRRGGALHGARSASDFTTSELKRLLASAASTSATVWRSASSWKRLQDALRGGDGLSGGAASAMGQLDAGERSVVELFQRVAPSVAFIQTSVVKSRASISLQRESRAFDPRVESEDDHSSQNQLTEMEPPKLGISRSTSPLSMRGEVTPSGSGSGFVWDTEGHVVTNYHVIQQAQKATVTGLGTGDAASMAAYDATLVGAEPEKDIAVLKVRAPASVLEPIEVGSSSELLVGQSVLAIGNPFGLDHTLTKGIVSAVGREVQGVAGRPIKGCVQTDAAINPGNSGGPLLDAKGRLIGVNTAIYSPSGASAGIGFAIPVDAVRRIVNQLIRYGRMLRPSMGISAPPNSPGADAGLVGCMRKNGQLYLGDLITRVNGTPVKTVEDLLTLVEETEIGSSVVLTVHRSADAKNEETLTVKTVDRSQLARS